MTLPVAQVASRLRNRFNSILIGKQSCATIGMTLLVKNEADIIRHNLEFHSRMGITSIVVTDNGSTDGTVEILEEYQRQGLIRSLLHDQEPGYRQKARVGRMVELLKSYEDTDWVINADADEFWFSSVGDLRRNFDGLHHNVVFCQLINTLPSCYGSTLLSTEVVRANDRNTTTIASLPKFSIFQPQLAKVAHSLKGYKSIHMGNHNVDMKYKSSVKTDMVRIYHYPTRGESHFLQKMTQGGAAVQGSANGESNHWKYFYHQIVDQGMSSEDIYWVEYLQQPRWEEFRNAGMIVEDTTMRDWFLQRGI